MKIAAYSIALNEEKHVARWAKACAGADGMFVLDTGSTDNTVELLKKHAVHTKKASISPWRFDVARNASLALIPSDYDICVSIDLDEVPEPEFWNKLRKQWKKGSNRGWIYMDTGTLWVSDRIHARHGFHWIYPIHEVTAPSMGTKVASCAIDATIRHRPDDSKSRAQYLTMLEQAVQEDPKSQRMLVYLIREYGFSKRWEDVVRVAEQLDQTGWDVERAAACRNAGDACTHMGRTEDALAWYKGGTDVLPNEPEPWIALAQHHYFQKNWEACKEAALKAEKTKLKNHYLSDPATMWKRYDFLSLAHWELGEVREALAAAGKALTFNPTDSRIKKNIAFYKQKV
jgi:glycosyltransferase involved in cell wall biosynthesis